MRDGCWHCKKWEEHFYWEHMEETSFHFMIVMVGDFSQSMELPRKFAKNFRVDLLYVIVLVAPNGKTWEVELCEEQDQFYFKGGWREFIEACGIEENYVLVFKYAGDSCFNVQIFDQTGCARVASNFIIDDVKDKAKKSCLRKLKMVDETPRNSQRSQPCKDQICSSSRVACHDDPVLHEIFEDDEKVGSYKIMKQEPFELHSQSSSETKWSMDDSHDNLKMLQLIFSSKYDSSFAKIIKPSVVRENPFMAIPRKFFSKHFRQKPDQIVLCDQSKKKWVMNCRLQHGGAWGFFGKSLQYFVQENNLEVFCLLHKSYKKHICPVGNKIEMTLLICPLCAQGVRLLPNEDPNIIWDTHVNCDCDPSNYQKTTKKKWCPVPGCKERLVLSNTIRCKDCTQEHCLRHRFAPDHICAGPKKPDTGFPFIGALRRSQKCESSPIQTSNGSPKWGLNFLNAASSIRASAEAGMQKLSIATNQALQKAKDGMAQGRCGDVGFVEKCLRCQASFSNVNALIEHVEKVHEVAVQPACTIMMDDSCPNCSKTFGDPVLLVEHVEKNH